MARVLTIQRAMVPVTERERYMARLRDREAYYKDADCRFWVFEEVGLPGLFIEFTEAGDIKRENVWVDFAAIMRQLPQG